MTAQEYQEWSRSTARYPPSYVNQRGPNDLVSLCGSFPFYLCLGLAGECGEVIEIFKKFWRRQDAALTQDEKESLKLELGDVLWYWTQICSELGLSIEEVMEANKQKLLTRQQPYG